MSSNVKRGQNSEAEVETEANWSRPAACGYFSFRTHF